MQTTNPVISVIIPFYNAASYIKEAVESVLNQDFAQVEVIAVDDGSTDNSAEVVKAINDPRVSVVHQANAGASVARNHGVKLAKGNYICFLDADDFWVPNKLSLQMAEIEKNDGVNMVFGQVKEFYDKSVMSDKVREIKEKTFVGYSSIAMLISKSDFLKVGEFQGKWQVAEFIDWYDRAKSLGLTERLLTEIVAYRRIHSKNVDRLYRPDVKQYVGVLRESLERRRRNQQ